ncbi:MAG: methylthioribulose 1-phosphate dehydratase [Cyanobium sp.]
MPAAQLSAMVPAPPAPDAPLQEEALALCRVMAAIHQRGWCDGSGGNVSVVLSWGPLELLMAPSGVDKGRVSPADLIVVNEEGQVVRGSGKASAETDLHLAILASSNAGAVLHTHSQAATLLSRLEVDRSGQVVVGGLEMLKGLEGIQTHVGKIAIPILPNSQDMAQLSEAARPLLAEAPHGLLIAGHGLYAWGTSLAQAQRHLEILEFLLEQQWRQLLVDALLQNTSSF